MRELGVTKIAALRHVLDAIEVLGPKQPVAKAMLIEHDPYCFGATAGWLAVPHPLLSFFS